MRWIYLPSTGIHCPPRPRSLRARLTRAPRCTLRPQVRLEFPGCALGAKAHPGKPRRTLAPFCVSKVHLGRILYFQGAPWHIKAHLGTSRRTLAHQGAPWVSRVRPGKSMRTLGAFCINKAHLGRIFYFQGAPWLVKAHLGSSRRTLAHQGAP